MKKKKQPEKVGDKFKYLGNLYTVSAFFGRSGVAYKTYAEARKMNPAGIISVEVKETGGAAYYESCELIE